MQTASGSASPAVPDPLSVIPGALAFGAVLGVGCQGLVTAAVRTLQTAAPTAPPTLGSIPTLVLLGGTFLGIVAAGYAAWTMLAPIGNPWRQAMLAIIAGLGSFVLSLVTIPLYIAFGRAGLVGLALVSGALCVLIARRLSAARAAA